MLKVYIFVCALVCVAIATSPPDCSQWACTMEYTPICVSYTNDAGQTRAETYGNSCEADYGTQCDMMSQGYSESSRENGECVQAN